VIVAPHVRPGEEVLAESDDRQVESGSSLRRLLTITVSTALAAGSLPVLCAQDLAPRAYIITPVHWNAITLSDAFNDGNILLEGAAPVTGSSGKGHVPALSLYHALRVFGRSASVVASLPYGVMNFHGTVAGAEVSAYRSGLLDAVFRFSVNLKGAPAMTPGEYGKWRQKTLLGFSVKVVAPTGQYDPTKLLNWGANRWAFRPELGLSRRWGHWVLDAYGGVWFYTTNPRPPGPRRPDARPHDDREPAVLREADEEHEGVDAGGLHDGRAVRLLGIRVRDVAGARWRPFG
jgi:hypothetical protein